MSDNTSSGCSWEKVGAEGAALLDKLKELIHAGNVRRVVIEHENRTVAEFPLTAGVVGVVVAPVLAATGALLALLQDCTVRVERTSDASGEPPRDRRDDTSPKVA